MTIVLFQNPWGAPTLAPSPCSLTDVMSEQLARQLHDEGNSDCPEWVHTITVLFPHVHSVDSGLVNLIVAKFKKCYWIKFLNYSSDSITQSAHLFELSSMCLILSKHFFCFSFSAELDLTCTSETETSSDLLLAQMLQMQFDREFDTQLRREEKKFNGDSKGKACL